MQESGEISAKCELHAQNSASSLTPVSSTGQAKPSGTIRSGARFSREFHHFSGDFENQGFSDFSTISIGNCNAAVSTTEKDTVVSIISMIAGVESATCDISDLLLMSPWGAIASTNMRHAIAVSATFLRRIVSGEGLDEVSLGR